MAAHKDEGPEPPKGSRQTPIWRLPTTRGAGASDTPDAEADRADRPTDRRVPLPVVLGLAAALICVGLYAAWAEFGSDIWGTGGEPDAAATPAAAPPAADEAGAGQSGGGVAATPPAEGAAAPVAAADDEPDEGSEADSPEDVATTAPVSQDGEAGSPQAAAPEPLPPATDPPSPAPALAADEPETAPAAASAREARAEAATSTADSQPPTQSDTPAEIGADALGALNERLDTLEAESAGAVGAGAAVIALEQRIRALEDDPTRAPLGQALAAWDEQRTALEASLADMSARLAHVEKAAAQQTAADGRLVTLVLATGALTAALGSSRPFAPMLDAVRGIAGEDPEIESALARLAPFAATGVPTLDGLSARFPEAANAIVRATPASDDPDWIDETVGKLSRLVTIRRTGGAIDPASLDGRLVEAETALEAGDLGRTIAIVEALMRETDEAGSAAPWLHDARARREADAALAGLVATVHGRIGARWASTGGAQ